MATKGGKKGTSIQTYRHSNALAIRLEYALVDERQSVFLNGELRSSFRCAPGYRAVHEFRGSDPMAIEKDSPSVWRVVFATELNTYRIRYEISRKNAQGEDTNWYWWDRNMEPQEWGQFPAISDGVHAVQQCKVCGSAFTCPVCAPPPPVCPDCGKAILCTTCNPRARACEVCGKELICPTCESWEPECSACGKGLVCTVCHPPVHVCDDCGEKLVCPLCVPGEPLGECPECGGVLRCETCDTDEHGRKGSYDAERMQDVLRLVDASTLQSALLNLISTQEDGSSAWPVLIEQLMNEVGCNLPGVRSDLDTYEDDDCVTEEDDDYVIDDDADT